jgi:hypothetical protein
MLNKHTMKMIARIQILVMFKYSRTKLLAALKISKTVLMFPIILVQSLRHFNFDENLTPIWSLQNCRY